jgi:enoyl-CoA hydratase
MPYAYLQLTKSDRVATLTINRPDKLNSLSDDVIGELEAAIMEVRSATDIGGLIVTGAGRAFVAGADIAELSGQSVTEGRARAQRGQHVFSLFESSPKPVIAAVNGFALGGGCELALACHIRIAGEAAQFGQPETKLGITPGYGGTQRLPRVVGRARALELLLTGDRIDAAEAYRIGLVNRVVPGDKLMSECEALLRKMLANGPIAVALCIDAVNRGVNMPLKDGLALEAGYFGILSGTADMREGMSAFLEKRGANFRGK